MIIASLVFVCGVIVILSITEFRIEGYRDCNDESNPRDNDRFRDDDRFRRICTVNFTS